MAALTRFTVDLITEDPLSEVRQAALANELSGWLHLLGVEQDDEMENVTDKYVNGHTHDSTETKCRQCEYHAYDSKNGNTESEK